MVWYTQNVPLSHDPRLSSEAFVYATIHGRGLVRCVVRSVVFLELERRVSTRMVNGVNSVHRVLLMNLHEVSVGVFQSGPTADGMPITSG